MVGVPHRQPGAGAPTFYGNGVRICLPSHVNVDSRVGGIVGVHRFLLSPSSRRPWGATRGHRLIAVAGRPAGRGDGSEGAGAPPENARLADLLVRPGPTAPDTRTGSGSTGHQPEPRRGAGTEPAGSRHADPDRPVAVAVADERSHAWQQAGVRGSPTMVPGI